MEIARRNMLKGGIATAGAISLAVAGSQALVSSAARADESAAESASGISWTREADLVIVGAGMGGLCAGVRALQNGIENVTIVEISQWLGGGTSFSAGTIHVGFGGSDEAEFNANSGHLNANNPLAFAAFSDIPGLIEWLGGLGLPLSANLDIPIATMLDADGAATLDGPHNFFDSFGALFQELGGTLLTQTAAKEIITSATSDIEGLRCSDVDGNPVFIKTSQIVLACGGFQNDSELKQRYLGVDGDMGACMGVPYNTGAGIKMPQKLGASLAGDFDRFAGLFLLAQPVKNWMSDPQAYEEHGYDMEPYGKQWMFATCIVKLPSQGILVDVNGERVGNENTGNSALYNMIKSTHGTGIAICDADGWDAWMEATSFTFENFGAQYEQVLASDEVGGIFYEADTIEELADALNASGIANHQVCKPKLLATVEEYNAAAEAGTTDQLAIPHTDGVPLAKAPFHAIPVTPAIFANFGGLAIDENAQVLDCTHQPISGLYATFPCAGSLMHEYYAGGIAHAGVTGLWAADAAAEALL